MEVISAILVIGIRLNIGVGTASGGVTLPLWAVLVLVTLFALRYRVSRKRR